MSLNRSSLSAINVIMASYNLLSLFSYNFGAFLEYMMLVASILCTFSGVVVFTYSFKP